MPLRITTWNVNGIRNPFSYKPWSEKENRSFAAMFDILEADIVCFQETKIQRKDLQDDMVLVPGWDSYFTFPIHKRGYSGVAIYTRNSTVHPLLVEEGITGILSPPKSSTPYLDLPPSETIGGYPLLAREDARVLDSEGRALVVDFGLFVLIGTYSPANRDEAREEFRSVFVETLIERIRNLVKMGRRVVVVGDLNISRGVLDSAGAEPDHGELTEERRLLNKLCLPHSEGVMVDLCREFWPDRKGMYTHWEQKINARPGNYGSRIDYVLCSADMRPWFTSSNIQEGLMGSDHCPVYAVLNDKITVDGKEHDLIDLVNPPGTFKDGVRQHARTLPPCALSAKCYPEYAGRRSITEMFGKKKKEEVKTVVTTSQEKKTGDVLTVGTSPGIPLSQPSSSLPPPSPSKPLPKSAPPTPPPPRPAKRQRTSATNPSTSKLTSTKSSSSQNAGSTGGQRALTMFFKTKSAPVIEEPVAAGDGDGKDGKTFSGETGKTEMASSSQLPASVPEEEVLPPAPPPPPPQPVDKATSKAAWSSLFTKKPPPKCDAHGEPCVMMTSKKPGANKGRAFWICPRPVGPEGQGKTFKKGEDTGEWRCNTFFWSSDWNG